MVLVECQFVPSYVALTFNAISRAKVDGIDILAAVFDSFSFGPDFLDTLSPLVTHDLPPKESSSTLYILSTCTVAVN
ncbi:uncharacterized protein ARMOST_00032 [Armillaria ostoyae]|uniref:Uncharacterized protein n=1 Tax=Armillaria ostoyae TaxID=47428 RepID=A0A284QK04_ARMOS|nr:uncharacterized protein ARMOST_00032 [Armillaria ostoyae]